VSSTGKKLVLLVVLVAVIAVLAKPLLIPKREFTVTPFPYTAYQQALAEGKPILLEFYASW
jgi:thiol:disulfide interchange protein